MVILKIPIVYLCWVVWWAIKAEPKPDEGETARVLVPKLLDVFQISVLQNIVHLLFGVAALALARTRDGARAFLLGGGLIYVVLFLYGAFTSQHSGANFIPLDRNDNILHLVLGLGMIL